MYPAKALRHYLLALQFFTRLPVTGRLAAWVGFSPAMLRASLGHFPGVGCLVGVMVATFSAGLLAGLPAGGFSPLVAAAWGTALGVLVTGAFHEDGLADVADGLGGAQDRDRALRIMKDSRVGAFGAIWVGMALLAKVSVLAVLASPNGGGGSSVLVSALVLGHVVSRTWPLFLVRLLPHIGDNVASKSKPVAEQISVASLCVALLWCFGVLALASCAQVAIDYVAFSSGFAVAIGVALGLSLLAWGVMWRWFAIRLQGYTGDCLGATQQVCELAFYLGLALCL
ncbi:adenosylcobinamide-GDP ribazoletransferase [Rhodoferax aquaticus]|uniref:Adenosylcobinamide-GDP ribazoletransferase n=1 Tax=Rhodoferax aquaticus TaxID=2527691 RepID=A0A515ENB1_9BURK|nr:adenosylcobinamide-GDP ribazoletransferase [Rhodoferax aquaticus]QDL54132.1 adenosylcobinamide-GDP ribazoletransferase [Rhodoferax aquaticus]